MKIKEVRKTIEQEASLTTGTIFLNGLELTHVPNEIEQLKHLSKVFLGSNRLRRFPDTILSIRYISLLHLDCNNIQVTFMYREREGGTTGEIESRKKRKK
tara:strand:- start:325 stop:624 length:300 start_codon:yes stop_codon:yes gene_type:complete